MSEHVKNIRSQLKCAWPCKECADLRAAADHLERLEKREARLREALEDLICHAENAADGDVMRDSSIDRARAALKEDE